MDVDQPNILVVDDDERLRELLQKFLSENNFFVITAADVTDARSKMASLSFDIIILDRMMPGESGLDFAADLRKSNDVPILMLTAMGELEDRIAGLEQGVDDYLTKPFEPRELLLRINSILKRSMAPESGVALSEVIMGDAKFDVERAQLTIAGKPVKLTTVEVLLLKSLSERPGTTLSRELLIEQTGADAAGRAIDVQVMRLRRKIEKNPRLPRYLQTVRGKGYVLLPD
ncbi:MAG: response regulator transcription factor [Rhodospirillaceae bacterium]|nr:response regulator transcription factor [Nitrosopumilus sp.]MDH5771636.1 response regulator transcription factor [Rhodospirillaceae bacterium]